MLPIVLGITNFEVGQGRPVEHCTFEYYMTANELSHFKVVTCFQADAMYASSKLYRLHVGFGGALSLFLSIH